MRYKNIIRTSGDLHSGIVCAYNKSEIRASSACNLLYLASSQRCALPWNVTTARTVVNYRKTMHKYDATRDSSLASICLNVLVICV